MCKYCASDCATVSNSVELFVCCVSKMGALAKGAKMIFNPCSGFLGFLAKNTGRGLGKWGILQKSFIGEKLRVYLLPVDLKDFVFLL